MVLLLLVVVLVVCVIIVCDGGGRSAFPLSAKSFLPAKSASCSSCKLRPLTATRCVVGRGPNSRRRRPDGLRIESGEAMSVAGASFSYSLR